MNDALSQFKDAIRDAGLEPPVVIEPGKFYRFPGAGKRNGNKAGWCKLFDDGLGGCFGDWSSDLSATWQVKRNKPSSRAERVAFACRIEAAKQQVEAVRNARWAASACFLAASTTIRNPARCGFIIKKSQ